MGVISKGREVLTDKLSRHARCLSCLEAWALVNMRLNASCLGPGTRTWGADPIPIVEGGGCSSSTPPSTICILAPST